MILVVKSAGLRFSSNLKSARGKTPKSAQSGPKTRKICATAEEIVALPLIIQEFVQLVVCGHPFSNESQSSMKRMIVFFRAPA